MLLLFLFTWHNSADVASFCFRMEVLLPERALSKIAVTIIILETGTGHTDVFPCFCYPEGCQWYFEGGMQLEAEDSR